MSFVSLFNHKKIVDLSAPIAPHWRYPISISPVKSFDQGNLLNIQTFNLQTHWYTHIDAPLHYVNQGKCLNDYPLLDLLVTKASVLNISEQIVPNLPITEDLLRKAVGSRQLCDMIFIRTDWGLQRPWESRAFWDDAPYMTKEASVYLRSLNPKVVGFDFPQDYDIRRASKMEEKDVCYTTHAEILRHGILMIEYMNNLWSLHHDEIDVVALPSCIPHADGAQIRVIAIEDDDSAD